MSEDQKLWFVYLVDHHEGPFSFQELAEKFTQKRITEKSLAWKDGLPEWQTIESIPDLRKLFAKENKDTKEIVETGKEEPPLTIESAPSSSSPTAAPTPAPSPAPESGIEKSTSPVLKSLEKLERTGGFKIGDPNEVLAKISQPSAGKAETTSNVIQASQESFLEEHGDIWILENAKVISGYHSWKKLREMSQHGRLLAGFKVWRQGWSEFQEGNKFSEQLLGTATGSPQSGTVSTPGEKSNTISSIVKRPRTGDTGLSLYPRTSTSNIHSKTISKTVTSTRRLREGSAKKTSITFVLLLLLLIVGAGGYYYLYIYSPLPSLDQVSTEDFQKLSTAVKPNLSNSRQIAYAKAKGDNTFYVASNLAEGTPITLKLKGKQGTLINAVHFEKDASAKLDQNHLATFSSLEQGGMLPTGEYELTISAQGVSSINDNVFIGIKGPTYQARLKNYQEKLQETYDQEVQLLKEIFETIKSVKTSIDNEIKEVKDIPNIPANEKKLAAKIESSPAKALIQQLQDKLEKKTNDEAIKNGFYPELFFKLREATNLLSQYQNRINDKPGPNTIVPDNIEARINSQLQDLENNIAQAVITKPADVLTNKKTETPKQK